MVDRKDVRRIETAPPESAGPPDRQTTVRSTKNGHTYTHTPSPLQVAIDGVGFVRAMALTRSQPSSNSSNSNSNSSNSSETASSVMDYDTMSRGDVNLLRPPLIASQKTKRPRD